MENLLNESKTLLNSFETGIRFKVDAYKGLGEAFKDFTPEAKNKKIAENQKRILAETSNYLQSIEPKLNSYFDEVEKQISSLIYPKRSSGISTEQQAGEQQFMSGLSLVNTKNEALIKSELKKSLPNSNRTDFSYSAFEILRNSDDFKPTFKDEIGTMFNNHPLAKEYTLSEKIKKNLNEVQSQVNYYKRAVSSGKLDSNYSVNRNIRQAV